MINRLMQYKHTLGIIVLVSLIGLLKLGIRSHDYEAYHIFISLLGFLQGFVALLALLLWAIVKGHVYFGNLIFAFVLVLLLEFTCYFLLGMPVFIEKEFDTPELDADHISTHLGFVQWGDTVLTQTKMNGQDTVYHAQYTIDSLNRRTTPGRDETKDKFALFFGGSVAYGHGLNDDETLPYQLQQKVKGYNAYNYANSGWGPQGMLARMEWRDLSEQVSEKDGLLVYVFLWSHIRRVIGDLITYSDWGWTMPYYTMEGGKLVRKGNFANGRFFASRFYELVYQSSIVKYFNLNFPIGTSREHMELTAEVLTESRKLFQETFGAERFVIIIHPGDWDFIDDDDKKLFKEILTERGLEFYDYSDVVVLDNETSFVGDGHPNAIAYDQISDLMIRDMGL